MMYQKAGEEAAICCSYSSVWGMYCAQTRNGLPGQHIQKTAIEPVEEWFYGDCEGMFWICAKLICQLYPIRRVAVTDVWRQ